MVDELLLKRLKIEVSLLRDDVEEIGFVEDSISSEDVLKKLKVIDRMVNEVIVDNFMGDDEDE